MNNIEIYNESFEINGVLNIMTSYEPSIIIENLLDLNTKVEGNKIVNKLFNIARSAYIFEEFEVTV